MESSAIGAGLFLFWGNIMGDILKSARAYEKLLDVEYQFILGRKNKQIYFSVFFNEYQFYHLAGLQYLEDRATLLYGDRKKLFYLILAEQIKGSQISSSEFYHQTEDKSSGKYFCRSFFPQTDKDYSIGQTNWTLLYKKKIHKSTGEEYVLYDRLDKNR